MDVDQDDPCKQISRYGLAQLYSKVISADEEWALVEPITREEIINVARKIFVPENLNMVIVGPYTEEIKKELEGIVESFQGLPAFVS